MKRRDVKLSSLTLAAVLCLATSVDAREWREVQQPYFGEVLFQFFQDNHFSALTHHLTSQHFARLGPHTEESELLYGGYSLGVALIQAGERESGVALLDEIGREPRRGEELSALRDKANVALAYVFLQSERPERAKSYLERVRLNGLLSNKALLGLG